MGGDKAEEVEHTAALNSKLIGMYERQERRNKCTHRFIDVKTSGRISFPILYLFSAGCDKEARRGWKTWFLCLCLWWLYVTGRVAADHVRVLVKILRHRSTWFIHFKLSTVILWSNWHWVWDWMLCLFHYIWSLLTEVWCRVLLRWLFTLRCVETVNLVPGNGLCGTHVWADGSPTPIV